MGKTKVVDGWKKEGSKEASEVELMEADGFEEPRAAANGRDCLPKAKRNKKSRATTYERFHRVLYSSQELNFLLFLNSWKPRNKQSPDRRVAAKD